MTCRPIGCAWKHRTSSPPPKARHSLPGYTHCVSTNTTTLTWWSVARRPKWVLALLASFVVVGVFSGLAQWQWERSVEQATIIERDTETPVPLASIAIPQSTMTTDASGRMVTVTCEIVASDDVWVSDRQMANGSADWLVQHCLTPDGHSLAVVAGWSKAAGDQLVADMSGELTGRYVPTESPQTSDFEAGVRQAIAIGELVNLWGEPGPVYGGYLVVDRAPEPLNTVPTDPPPTDAELNILNIFYAIQWLIFAAFALYFWYRLVRDELEKELDAPAQESVGSTS
jgi:surfeit locus 1 family protein